jgi:hypothetical protein
MLICILSVYINSVLAEEGFAHLFTSAKQRQILNQLRAHQTQQQEQVPDRPTFQGYVKRSDGVSTLWLDQVPVQQIDEQVLVNAKAK